MGPSRDGAAARAAAQVAGLGSTCGRGWELRAQALSFLAQQRLMNLTPLHRHRFVRGACFPSGSPVWVCVDRGAT